MISNYTQEQYLRARHRQENIADKIALDADEQIIKPFLQREERLQAYELTHTFKEDEDFVHVEIEDVLLFKLCVLARRARITTYDFIEMKLEESLA